MGMLKDLIGKDLNPSEFAKFYFDWNPFPYQEKALNCMKQNVILVWGRQCGKSTITAIRGLWEAMWNDNSIVIVLAHKQRQSNILFRKIKNLLSVSTRKLPELKMQESITRETQTVLEFSNGSEIHALPIAVDGANIRGFTANFVIMDEAARVVSEDAWSAVNPMTIVTRGKKWLISTPFGTQGFFYEAYKNPGLGYKHFRATAFENPLADADQIDKDRLRMPDLFWRQEYMAEFLSDVNAFFPFRLVEASFSETIRERDAPLAHCEYFLGVDPARFGRDDTVFIIIEQNPLGFYSVCKYIETQRETIPQIIGRIKAYDREWNFRKIIVDETGIGTGIGDILTEDQYPIIPMRMTIKSKEDMFNWLKQMLEEGKLRLLPNPKMRKQLLDIKWEYSQTGFIKLFTEASKSSHNVPGGDDYAVALALAAWGIKMPKVPVLFATGRGIHGE